MLKIRIFEKNCKNRLSVGGYAPELPSVSKLRPQTPHNYSCLLLQLCWSHIIKEFCGAL